MGKIPYSNIKTVERLVERTYLMCGLTEEAAKEKAYMFAHQWCARIFPMKTHEQKALLENAIHQASLTIALANKAIQEACASASLLGIDLDFTKTIDILEGVENERQYNTESSPEAGKGASGS